MENQKNAQSFTFQDHKKAILLGVAVGDALGEPVEFEERENIQ